MGEAAVVFSVHKGSDGTFEKSKIPTWISKVSCSRVIVIPMVSRGSAVN
jgi:hypothetical protein